MNKYRFLYLLWLLPVYFLTMCFYQLLTYQGINRTFNTGESYVADVIDFDIKQIAAQTSGYVVLSFHTDTGQRVEQRLSLPIQMAQVLMEFDRIPVRYEPASFRQIVIVSTFELQRNVVRVNLAITLFGFLATALLGIYATGHANRKIRDGDTLMIFERTDREGV